MSVYTRIPIFVCFAGRLVNTPRMAVPSWRLMCTPSFLGVPGVMVGWPRTKGTASNERVHSFCGFLPNPFIQDLCLWLFEFVKTDLYPLSRGLWSLSGMPSVRPGTGLVVQKKDDCNNKKNSHLILEMSMNEAFIWLSGLHWQKKNVHG